MFLKKASTNIKTGPIPVSTSPRESCPDSCLLKNNGCYAENFPMSVHWDKVSRGERGVSWSDFLDSIRRLPRNQIWRHDQAGDLAGKHECINRHKLYELVKANKGRRGFTYTHYPVFQEDIRPLDLYTVREGRRIANFNRACIKWANENGFTINLSGNNPTHAKKLQALNIGPVVSVVEMDYETDSDIVICPAVHGEYVSCATCQLCQKDHKKIIGFPVHGSRKKTAGQIAKMD